MKTAIFNGVSPGSRRRCLGLRSVIVIAALAAGNLFGQPTVKTLGGGASGSHSGYQNGETIDALFDAPMGLAMSESGNLFVADYRNNAIRQLSNLTGTGNGTTITWATNSINAPVGVAVDADGNLFVLNRGGTGAFCTNGTVLEFDEYGILIATIATHLTNAAALGLDPSDNIYVTERTNLLIKITPSPVTETTITTITNANAFLEGVAYLPSGNLAVCDYGRDGIYTVSPNTVPALVTTNAGFNGPGDGTGPGNIGIPNSLAQFFQPCGVAAAGDGTLIVSDFGNDRVKVVTLAGVTTNLYGVSSNDWVSPYPGWMDGSVVVPDEIGGVASRCPVGVALAPSGSTVYTSEDYYHIIRQTTGTAFAQFVAPPGAPTGLTAVVATNGSGAVEVLLTWNPVATGGVTNYILERSTSSGGPYNNEIYNTGTTTSFTDTSIADGTTYYYVVQAGNSGGEGPISSQVSVTIPVPPPASPSIGWFDYEFNGTIYVSVFHPITGVFGTENDLALAITNASGLFNYYVAGPTPLSENPTNDGSAPPSYANGEPVGTQSPLTITTASNLTIEAVSQNSVGEYSAIVTANILYQCGPPAIDGTNAAQFYVSDPTTNVTYYYTTDGTDPLTNAPPSQQIASANGQPVQFSVNISSNFVFSVRALRAGYLPSGLVTNLFLAQNFQGNEISWGFASGEASSEFVASPGQVFYAPVTLTTLSGTVIYSMEFDMVVTNLGPDQVPSGDFYFQSMMDEPLAESNTDVTVWEPIPPLMFIGEASSPPPPSQIVSWNGTNFVNEEVADTNLNELATGWFEIYGKTNLYNTTAQNLISHSQAYIDVFPGGEEPNGVIVGGYSFQVPTNAQPGERYEIQLNRPSANGDGLGGDDSAVVINAPTIGSVSNGPINSIKIVTVGQPKYLVGDIYPFRWFNAGDFGAGDLIQYGANDVEGVFNAAIYQLNVPPPGSDFYDAMDSAGGLGALDSATGYWTNENVTLNSAQYNALFNINDNTTINEMAFGDGKLDVCDVYVTFLRSQFPSLYWFQRFYTNDPVHGVFGLVAQPITTQTNVDSETSMALSTEAAQPDNSPSTVSITNSPLVQFAAGDYLASPGQSLSIPITASVFGLNPLRMLMLNVNVVPLDGSPAVTTPITFTPNAPFNDSSIYNQIQTNSVNNYAAAFLPVASPIPASAQITGSNVVGYLNIIVPANATSMSAYDLYFTHASASPNGLISFPKTTYPGLITLSSRTNSYYNDGIPDSWRLRYFGTIYNELSVSNADADGTSMDNWQKYQAGLNPMDSSSVLNEGTDQAMAQNQQDLVLYWPTVSGQIYIVKRSSALFPPQWTAISTNIGDGTYMEIHDTSGGNTRYYQVTTPQ